MRQFTRDIQDYGRVNKLSDAQVDSLLKRYRDIMEISADSYREHINDISTTEPFPGNKEMLKALKDAEDLVKQADKAVTRQDKVLLIDKILSAEHSRGGKMLSWGYGFGDTERGDRLIQSALDWLRNQTKFTAGKIPPPASGILYRGQTGTKGIKVNSGSNMGDPWKDLFPKSSFFTNKIDYAKQYGPDILSINASKHKFVDIDNPKNEFEMAIADKVNAYINDEATFTYKDGDMIKNKLFDKGYSGIKRIYDDADNTEEYILLKDK